MGGVIEQVTLYDRFIVFCSFGLLSYKDFNVLYIWYSLDLIEDSQAFIICSFFGYLCTNIHWMWQALHREMGREI